MIKDVSNQNDIILSQVDTLYPFDQVYIGLYRVQVCSL